MTSTPKHHSFWRRCKRPYAALFASICMLILLMPAGLSAADGGKAIFFGDSTTRNGEWHTTVGEAMGWTAINAGVARRWLTRNSLVGLEMEFVKNGDATHLFIMLGLEDVASHNRIPEGQRITNSVAAMDQLITAALEHVPAGNIVILGPCNTNPDNLQGGEKRYANTPPLLEQLNTHFAQLAQERGVRFLSLYATVSPEHQPDGLDPNAAGSAEIAQAIIAFLRTSTPGE